MSSSAGYPIHGIFVRVKYGQGNVAIKQSEGDGATQVPQTDKTDKTPSHDIIPPFGLFKHG